jgi:hypothetical protein
MNKFDDFESELNKIQENIRTNGQTLENTKRLNDLLSNTKLVIALGPTEVFVRERDNPNIPDEIDFKYYSEVINQAEVCKIFDDEHWGDASVSIEVRNYKGVDVPALIVKWVNVINFVADQNSGNEEFGKKISGYGSTLGLLLGIKWIDWIVEVV